MIKFLSSWAKGLALAIVIVSILEMLLPNNKTKKYIRMVMGLYILFTILSPFIQNKDQLDIHSFSWEDYVAEQTGSQEVNQTSMIARIEELYVEELEKDITKKLEEKGYEVTSCEVKAQISKKEEETKINQIKIKVKKGNKKEEQESESMENKVVAEIQKIKPIDTSIEKKEKSEETKEQEEDKKITKTDIQNIKKFLIEEYEVKEKCLEIN